MAATHAMSRNKGCITDRIMGRDTDRIACGRAASFTAAFNFALNST